MPMEVSLNFHALNLPARFDDMYYLSGRRVQKSQFHRQMDSVQILLLLTQCVRLLVCVCEPVVPVTGNGNTMRKAKTKMELNQCCGTTARKFVSNHFRRIFNVPSRAFHFGVYGMRASRIFRLHFDGRRFYGHSFLFLQ